MEIYSFAFFYNSLSVFDLSDTHSTVFLYTDKVLLCSVLWNSLPYLLSLDSYDIIVCVLVTHTCCFKCR